MAATGKGSQKRPGSELSIVDNSDADWKVLSYLQGWCWSSKSVDVALRAAARRLGFERCGEPIHKALAPAVSGLIRQTELRHERSGVRRRG